MAREKTSITIGSFEEEVDMPDGVKYLITQDDPFLRYNRVTRKYELVVMEHIMKYDATGEKLRQAYSNEIITDYDASDKVIFEYKLKGRTEPDDPLSQ